MMVLGGVRLPAIRLTKTHEMKRITKATKAIADAHIAAKAMGVFDDPHVTTREEVIALLKDGKTFKEVLFQIEARFVPFGTIMISAVFGQSTTTYKRGVYEGFKKLLD